MRRVHELQNLIQLQIYNPTGDFKECQYTCMCMLLTKSSSDVGDVKLSYCRLRIIREY